jgi:hypothetical protein
MTLRLIFNGAQTSVSKLEDVISSIGDYTSITVNTAQAYSESDLSSINQTLGNKVATFQFNASQTSLSLMQQFLSSAGANTRASLNTANIWSSNDLVSLANSAGTNSLVQTSMQPKQSYRLSNRL